MVWSRGCMAYLSGSRRKGKRPIHGPRRSILLRLCRSKYHIAAQYRLGNLLQEPRRSRKVRQRISSFI
ncbi:hypothetical protein CV770_07885 [Bradyrhizobium sp. AC87j1]|nr:hypothetical protein CV770_07885 [Bradyrhizobium sp. AC87j1]